MTQEEKAHYYDEAIERARYWEKNPTVWSSDDICQKLFPELKESEDERIRKELIQCFSDLEDQENEWYGSLTPKQIVAWLEKQGETFTKKDVDDAYIKGVFDAKQEFEKQDSQLLDNSAKTCKDEQKHTDIIEPKFKVGQWIVWQDKCYKVNYNGCGYELIDQNGLSTSLEYGTIDENAHIWDITKAKDGDVLASNRSIFIFSQEYIAGKPEAYCGIMNGLFLMKPEGCWTNEKCYPATKEQRDTLEKAMTDAGYTFDFKKKELKKIEKKSSWSEEDEDNFKRLLDEIVCLGNNRNSANRLYYDRLIKFIKELKNRAQPKEKWCDKDERMLDRLIAYFEKQVAFTDDDNPSYANWLKSLRPQNTWKPSDEQLDALHDAAVYVDKSMFPHTKGILMKLYEQLKKL